MKKLLTLCTLALLVLACGKKEQLPDTNGQPSDGGNSSGDVLIESISMPATISMDSDWAGGVLLTVTLGPSGASFADLAASAEDPSVVSVAKEGSIGFRLKPLKQGSTNVTVRATRGPASPQVCKVTVTAPGISDAKELAEIKLQQTSVELSDLTPKGEAEFAQIPIDLSPADAGITDLKVEISDASVHAELVPGDPISLLVTIPANTSHAATNVRTAKVTLKAKRGPAANAVLNVGIRGHVKSLSFDIFNNASHYNVEKDEIHISKGDASVNLGAKYETTGTLKTGGNAISYEVSGGVQVNSNNLLSFSGSTYTGSGSSLTVKATCGAVSQSFKVHTYPAAEGITITDNQPSGMEHNYLRGSASYRLSVFVTPQTARHRMKYSYSGTGISDITKDDGLSENYPAVGTIDFKAVKSTNSSEYIDITVGGKTVSWELIVNDYLSTDLKVGDYVYWSGSASNPTFRSSDGGLRAFGVKDGKDWWRRAQNVAPDTKNGETLIGVVFDVGVSDSIDDIPAANKKGIGGKHVGVVAKKDIYNGANPRQTLWCDAGQADPFASLSSSQKPTVSNRHTYLVWTREKAVSSKLGFVTYVEGFSSASDGVALPSTGTTGWMLPTKNDAETMAAYAYPIQLALSQSGCTQLYNTYWTSSYESQSNNKINYAYQMTWTKSNNVYTGTTSTMASATNLKLRPVVIL